RFHASDFLAQRLVGSLPLTEESPVPSAATKPLRPRGICVGPLVTLGDRVCRFVLRLRSALRPGPEIRLCVDRVAPAIPIAWRSFAARDARPANATLRPETPLYGESRGQREP